MWMADGVSCRRQRSNLVRHDKPRCHGSRSRKLLCAINLFSILLAFTQAVVAGVAFRPLGVCHSPQTDRDWPSPDTTHATQKCRSRFTLRMWRGRAAPIRREFVI